MNKTAFLPFICGLVLGCGDNNRYEDYHFQSAGDIVLTEQNHPHGYGKSECFYCHVKVNIHQKDRLGNSAVGLARQLVEQSGISSCSGCHGKNGLE